jgi:hypothetical protein
MSKGFISIPFKISDVNSGFSTVDGMAKISSAGIVLEYEQKFIGLIKTGIKEIQIPIEQIERIKFKKGWVNTRLEIWLNNFQTLSKIPNKDGRIVMDLSKEDRKVAEEAVQILEKATDEYKAELPPPKTPVSSLFETDELEIDDLKNENPGGEN